MGNFCSEESEESGEQKKEIKKLYNTYNFSWTQAIQSQITNIEAIRDIQLRFQDENKPYLPAIRILQKVQQKYGPASKAKVVFKMSQVITNCMTKGRGKSLLLASDHILPVLRYIIIKSQIYDIHVHIFILQNLLTQNVLSSSLGYFITSLQASIES